MIYSVHNYIYVCTYCECAGECASVGVCVTVATISCLHWQFIDPVGSFVVVIVAPASVAVVVVHCTVYGGQQGLRPLTAIT